MSGGSWSLAPGDMISFSFDDGETTVMFDRSSGDSHFLSMLPALVLEQLASHPLSYEQLVRQLADGSAADLDDDATAAIATTLDYLEGAELVQFEPPQTD